MWLWNPKNHWCGNIAPNLPQSMCSGLSSSQSLPQTCPAVSASPNLTILILQFCSILIAPPSLQVLWGACENALAESESTVQSSRRGWEHVGVLSSSDEGCQSVWEVCVWLPDWITFCWWKATEERKGKGNGKGKGIVEQTPGRDNISRAMAWQLQKEMYLANSDMEG